jgi:hypothetical protein
MSAGGRRRVSALQWALQCNSAMGRPSHCMRRWNDSHSVSSCSVGLGAQPKGHPACTAASAGHCTGCCCISSTTASIPHHRICCGCALPCSSDVPVAALPAAMEADSSLVQKNLQALCVYKRLPLQQLQQLHRPYCLTCCYCALPCSSDVPAACLCIRSTTASNPL